MTLQDSPPVSVDAVTGIRPRYAYADNLKVLLVVGVIVGHATMAWTGVGDWVFDEPNVREPLLSILILLSVVGALFAMPLFFLVAGAFTPASLQRKGLRRFLIDRLVRLGLPMIFFIIFLSPIIEYVDPGSAGWDTGFGA
ncbi:MAG: acyltransferase, partial [Acidimicrobiia bacterium]|nr:acyltransferase [Acidimicrobiia bacterium]